MKRAPVFLLLGPSLVVVATWVAFGMPLEAFAVSIALLLFVFVVPVSAIAGLIDGYLARTLPILLRASLTAIVGSMAAVGLFLALFGKLQPQDLMPALTFGGLAMGGVCSLLAHDYRRATA
jgi:hypothetical protein